VVHSSDSEHNNHIRRTLAEAASAAANALLSARKAALKGSSFDSIAAPLSDVAETIPDVFLLNDTAVTKISTELSFPASGEDNTAALPVQENANPLENLQDMIVCFFCRLMFRRFLS
jgi:hypothetical protein